MVAGIFKWDLCEVFQIKMGNLFIAKSPAIHLGSKKKLAFESFERSSLPLQQHTKNSSTFDQYCEKSYLDIV